MNETNLLTFAPWAQRLDTDECMVDYTSYVTSWSAPFTLDRMWMKMCIFICHIKQIRREHNSYRCYVPCTLQLWLWSAKSQNRNRFSLQLRAEKFEWKWCSYKLHNMFACRKRNVSKWDLFLNYSFRFAAQLQFRIVQTQRTHLFIHKLCFCQCFFFVHLSFSYFLLAFEGYRWH